MLIFVLITCRNEALRVAFIHEEDVSSDGRKEYYSKLVKADVHGKDQVSIFSLIFLLIFTLYGACF